MLQKPIFGHTWSLLTKVVTMRPKYFRSRKILILNFQAFPWIENSKTTNIKNLEFELKKRTLPYCALHICTGKSLSEALILASTNPQYDKILFIELRVQYKKITSSEHVVYINCFELSIQKQKTICVHNMFLACSFHVLNS